jgi:hypothetical protein
MREVKVLEVFIVLDVVMYSSVRLFAVYSMRVKLFCIDSCRVCPETCLITMLASVSTRNNRESPIYLVNCKVRSDCDRLLDCSCVENSGAGWTLQVLRIQTRAMKAMARDTENHALSDSTPTAAAMVREVSTLSNRIRSLFDYVTRTVIEVNRSYNVNSFAVAATGWRRVLRSDSFYAACHQWTDADSRRGDVH